MLVGALILLVGIVIGRMWGRVASKPQKAISGDPEPTCGCKHHYAMHAKDGHCHAADYDRWREESVPCTCQRYTGPEPLPTYTAEIGPA